MLEFVWPHAQKTLHIAYMYVNSEEYKNLLKTETIYVQSTQVTMNHKKSWAVESTKSFKKISSKIISFILLSLNCSIKI